MSAMPYGSQPVRPLPKGLAVASLVLGILGVLTSWFLLGGLLGLVAVILGGVTLGKVKRGEADGKGLAIGGIVTGAVAMVLALIVVVAGAVFFAKNADDFSNLAECLQAAGDDQVEVNACTEEFSRQLGP